MRALSIHQPWAWAILHTGKDIENRTWRTHHRGPMLVHAAKTRATFDRVADLFEDRFGVALPAWDELDVRAIVGVVDVIDCVRDSASRWAEPGYWHWVLANPRLFDEAIPYRGAQLLFRVPDEMYGGIVHNQEDNLLRSR